MEGRNTLTFFFFFFLKGQNFLMVGGQHTDSQTDKIVDTSHNIWWQWFQMEAIMKICQWNLYLKFARRKYIYQTSGEYHSWQQLSNTQQSFIRAPTSNITQQNISWEYLITGYSAGSSDWMSGEASTWKGWKTSSQQTKDGALQVLTEAWLI